MKQDQEKTITVRMSEALHTRLANEAHKDRISMNRFVKSVLEGEFEERDSYVADSAE